MKHLHNTPTLAFSRASLRAIDREAVEQYGMQSIVLMENAAKGAANIILEYTLGSLKEEIVVVCGTGNNGGDGYATARHLANQNCNVRIVQMGEPKTVDAIENATIATKMNIKITPWSESALSNATLIVDAIFGSGLDRVIEGQYANAIHTIIACEAPCIALDLPSGLDCDTGLPLACCIEASMTITFVGMKLGFLLQSATQYTGEVYIADIGCPDVLLQTYGVTSTEYDA